MAPLGSDEWVAELDRAVAAVAGGEALVVQYELADGDGAWYLEMTPAGVRARPGRHEDPDVVLRADRAVVEAVNAGERSALAAFYDGELRFRGDLRRLAPAAAALKAVGRVPAG